MAAVPHPRPGDAQHPVLGAGRVGDGHARVGGEGDGAGAEHDWVRAAADPGHQAVAPPPHRAHQHRGLALHPCSQHTVTSRRFSLHIMKFIHFDNDSFEKPQLQSLKYNTLRRILLQLFLRFDSLSEPYNNIEAEFQKYRCQN